MTKFFLGQRVKLIRKGADEGGTGYLKAESLPIGSEGRITSVGPFSKGETAWDGFRFGFDCDVTVTFDSCKVDRAIQNDDITPILPSGHVAGEEGRCKPLDHLLSRLKGVEA